MIHVELQPSPLNVFLSSHCSPAAIRPSPQDLWQAPLMKELVSTKHAEHVFGLEQVLHPDGQGEHPKFLSKKKPGLQSIEGWTIC